MAHRGLKESLEIVDAPSRSSGASRSSEIEGVEPKAAPGLVRWEACRERSRRGRLKQDDGILTLCAFEGHPTTDELSAALFPTGLQERGGATSALELLVSAHGVTEWLGWIA